MGQQTNIAWTDSTVNFLSGCTEVSQGCSRCYARELSKRFPTLGKWGKGAPRQLHESAFKLAHRLNKKPWVCNDCGAGIEYASPCHAMGKYDTPQGNCRVDSRHTNFHRRRIFSLSLGDWLDPEVPIEWLARMLDTIRQCDQVVWQLVTKRPELWRERMIAAQLRWDADSTAWNWIAKWLGSKALGMTGTPPPNIWLLTSVENQEMADERIPHLLKIPAVVHGLSCEPLLGPIELPPGFNGERTMADGMSYTWSQPFIDWIIAGGESGPEARPCNVEWIRSLVKQGQAASVPVFVKQLGSQPSKSGVGPWGGGIHLPATKPNGSPLVLQHPKGGDINEWPNDLRVQQFPKT